MEWQKSGSPIWVWALCLTGQLAPRECVQVKVMPVIVIDVIPCTLMENTKKNWLCLPGYHLIPTLTYWFDLVSSLGCQMEDPNICVVNMVKSSFSGWSEKNTFNVGEGGGVCVPTVWGFSATRVWRWAIRASQFPPPPALGCFLLHLSGLLSSSIMWVWSRTGRPREGAAYAACLEVDPHRASSGDAFLKTNQKICPPTSQS